VLAIQLVKKKLSENYSRREYISFLKGGGEDSYPLLRKRRGGGDFIRMEREGRLEGLDLGQGIGTKTLRGGATSSPTLTSGGEELSPTLIEGRQYPSVGGENTRERPGDPDRIPLVLRGERSCPVGKLPT